ncbi:MAG: hypothetical protein IRZ14_10720 [Chloroflexi bacterium]|nr:hypothetical protein [Chloroflexota bacterium]
MDLGRRRGPGWRIAELLLVAVLLFVVAAPAQAEAQGTIGQGPRFPTLGPGLAPPEAEGPARPNSPLPPGRTARCRWDLRGVWESRGQQTDPVPNTYGGRLLVRQYGNYLVIEQLSENLTYYGVCSGDRVELDAYMGDTFVGMQTGTVSANGRRIESTWVLYTPDYAAGYETLTAVGRAPR